MDGPIDTNTENKENIWHVFASRLQSDEPSFVLINIVSGGSADWSSIPERNFDISEFDLAGLCCIADFLNGNGINVVNVKSFILKRNDNVSQLRFTYRLTSNARMQFLQMHFGHTMSLFGKGESFVKQRKITWGDRNYPQGRHLRGTGGLSPPRKQKKERKKEKKRKEKKRKKRKKRKRGNYE